MATVDIDGYYWYAPFGTLALSPVSADALFVVSNLIISDAFPAGLQSLAIGVFAEVGQIGNAVDLAVTAAIASSVTEHSGAEARDRAGFWTISAATVVIVVIAFLGLRKHVAVGKKDD